jgi:cobaltochelatase CobS
MSNVTKKARYIADVFGINVPRNNDLVVEVYDGKVDFVPKLDKDFRFRPELLGDILAWLRVSETLKDGLFLTGPTGSGKSSILTQIAARMNRPMQRVTAHSRMEMPELIGHHIVMDGDLMWQDGPLTIAMRHGHMFLLDEMDLLDPATAAGLNGILEGAPLMIPENGGEVVEPHEDFRFVATGNTNGGGDRTGLFQGTLQQNAAFMDRMWVVEVGYAVPEVEKEILSSVCPSVPDYVADTMIEIANEVRGLFMGKDGNPGAIEVTLSTRTLVRWATLSWFFQGKKEQGINPINYALDRALANRASPETKTALHEIVQRHFGK